MTSLEAALAEINVTLSRLHVSFALVGGLAVLVRTEPRFTRDADLAVALGTDKEAEALIHALRAHGFLIAAVVEQEAVGRDGNRHALGANRGGRDCFVPQGEASRWPKARLRAPKSSDGGLAMTAGTRSRERSRRGSLTEFSR